MATRQKMAGKRGPIKITNKIESLVNKKFEVIFFLTDTDDVSSINKKYRENRVLSEIGDFYWTNVLI